MPRKITFRVCGEVRTGVEGDSLLAALMNAGQLAFRTEDGASHAPICGMGVCFECLVQVRGRGPVRACMIALEEGMEVEL